MAFNNPNDALKSGIVTTGERGTVMCNLPHGLDVSLRDPKTSDPHTRVVFNGRNHRRAIDTDTTEDGRWGSTPNVSEDFWKQFEKTNHPAVKNGNIFFVKGDSTERALDTAEEMGDAIQTGTNPINPDKPADGVEKREDD
jgi:hypothetical protein